MSRWIRDFVIVLGLVGGPGTAVADTGSATPPDVPVVRLPDTLYWTSPPWDDRVSATWILGGERQAGPYLQRVRIAPGGRIPRHVHPDTRQTTVLSGTLHVSFGATGESTTEVTLPEGSVYVVPAGVAHEVRPGDGEVLYQEAGTGPTATNLLSR